MGDEQNTKVTDESTVNKSTYKITGCSSTL